MQSQVNSDNSPSLDQISSKRAMNQLRDFTLAEGQANGNLLESLMQDVDPDPLPELAYNPTFSMEREANVLELAREGKLTKVQIRGATAVHLNGLHLASPGWGTEISDSNKNYQHEITGNVENLISPHASTMLSTNDIVELSKAGISGAHFRDGALVFEASGVPLQCVDVRFLRMTGVEVPEIYPFRATDGTPLAPLVGDLMLAGREISHTTAPSLPELASVDGRVITAPAFTHQGRALVAFGLWELPVEHTDKGGLKFSSLGAGAQEQTPDTVPVVGWHFVGVGTRRYVFNPVEIDTPTGPLNLTDDEIVLLSGAKSKIGRKAYIQDQRYAGKSGIPLDRKHQRISDSPTGGDAVGNTDVERDLLLWEHGAQMARVMCACFEIANREKLVQDLGTAADSMVCERTFITAGPVFDDTHRLDMFFVDDENLTTVASIYDTFLKTEYGTADAETRTQHLTDLSFNMGTNIRVCLALKFVNHPDQAVETNVSRKGKLLDSGNFEPMKNRFQTLDMVFPALETIAAMSTIDGSSGKGYFTSSAFASFVSGFLGKEADEQTLSALRRRTSTGTSLEEHVRQLGGRYTSMLASHNVAIELSKRVILDELRAEGKGFNASQVLRLFLDDTNNLLLPREFWNDQDQVRKWAVEGIPDRFTPKKSSMRDRNKSLNKQEVYELIESVYVSKVLASRKFQLLPGNSQTALPLLEEVERSNIFTTGTKQRAAENKQQRPRRKKLARGNKPRRRS